MATIDNRLPTEGTQLDIVGILRDISAKIAGGGEGGSIQCIANRYSTTTQYHVGDYVIYNDNLYKCITDHIGEWEYGDWSAITVADELLLKQDNLTWDTAPTEGSTNAVNSGAIYSANKQTLNIALGNVAPTFDKTAVYGVGDYVVYSSTLYECIVPHSGPWRDMHFKTTTVAEALQGGGATGKDVQLRKIISTIEDGDVATVAHAKDELLQYTNSTNNMLCFARVTDNIAIGDIIADGTNVTNILISDILVDVTARVSSAHTRIDTVNSNITSTFSESIDYVEGDYVLHDDMVYRCIVDHPAGAWDVDHFAATNVTAMLKSVKYSSLLDLPTINGVELSGDLSLEDLDVKDISAQEIADMWNNNNS